jgi:hypothetical protein
MPAAYSVNPELRPAFVWLSEPHASLLPSFQFLQGALADYGDIDALDLGRRRAREFVPFRGRKIQLEPRKLGRLLGSAINKRDMQSLGDAEQSLVVRGQFHGQALILEEEQGGEVKGVEGSDRCGKRVGGPTEHLT